MLLYSPVPWMAKALTAALCVGYTYIDVLSGILSSLFYMSTLHYITAWSLPLSLLAKIHASAWIA